VRLRAAAAGPTVEIELSDEAGGLPLDVRLEGFDAPMEPREGLGLLLAARLVEQNGGRLEYLSAEGRSSFRVSLPGRVDAAADRLV
jgi:two-component system nitrogen regulation sensor histidine kinase GlnL